MCILKGILLNKDTLTLFLMSSDIPVKILLLAADPENTLRLRLLQEVRDSKERLRNVLFDIYFSNGH